MYVKDCIFSDDFSEHYFHWDYTEQHALKQKNPTFSVIKLYLFYMWYFDISIDISIDIESICTLLVYNWVFKVSWP